MALPDSIRWFTPEAIVSVLTTELNALANASMSAASALQDQDASEFTFVDFELAVTFGTAPAAGMRCTLYASVALDGTNFTSTDAEQTSQIIAAFILGATTTQRVVARNVMLPPTDFKIALYNESGVAFPATGSTLKMRRYSTQIVD
jgi:hypothetical protein